MPFLRVLTLASVVAAVIEFPIQRQPFDETAGLEKRQQSTNIQYLAPEGGYYLTIGVGTPPQNVSVHVDTGSSVLWVPQTGSKYCSSKGAVCSQLGAFSPSQSSSLVNSAGSVFREHYKDGTSVKGSYFQDTVSVQGQTVSNVTLGLATTGSAGHKNEKIVAVMGISYPDAQSVAATNGAAANGNIITRMQAAKLTNTRAFSLWLNDINANAGTILFGGVDTAKFVPPLLTIPLEPDVSTGKVIKYVVSWTGLSYSGASSNQSISGSYPLAVLLDSGTTSTELPTAIVNQMYKVLGATVDGQNGALASCALKSSTTGFVFNFAGPSGPNITLPLSQMLKATTDTKGIPLHMPNGDPACKVLIKPTNSTNLILGDTFLRAAYIVFDQDNNQAALANTVYNATASKILPITSGTALPSATAVPNPVRASYNPGAAAFDSNGIAVSPNDAVAPKDGDDSGPVVVTDPAPGAGVTVVNGVVNPTQSPTTPFNSVVTSISSANGNGNGSGSGSGSGSGVTVSNINGNGNGVTISASTQSSTAMPSSTATSGSAGNTAGSSPSPLPTTTKSSSAAAGIAPFGHTDGGCGGLVLAVVLGAVFAGLF